MELRHLRYFVAVAEEQNVTRAAARLHVSQPPLSRQIRDLEDELGVNLFEHGAKTIRLTPAGRVFLEEARSVLARAEEAVRAARATNAAHRATLELAYAPSLAVEILPGILREFQRQAPQIRVNLHDLSTQQMIEGLHRDTLGLALMIDPGAARLRGLQFEELYCYPLRLAVHPSHPLASRRAVKVPDLVSERIIAYSKSEYPEYHERIAGLFSKTGPLPQMAEEHDSSTALIASVEAGRGVAFVPASLGCLTGPRLKLLRLEPAPESLKIGLARRKGVASAVVEAFTTAARACKVEKIRV